MNSKKIFTGAALLAGFFASSYAGAFNFLSCDGDPIIWEEPFQMVRNLPSFPPGGSSEAAVNNAIDRWNGVQGMANMVSMSPFVTLGLSATTGDGQNDVGISPQSSIGGNNGLTLMIHSWCVFSSSWQEADVFVASNIGFGHVNEDTLVVSGRSAFMHEFGHAQGLEHQQTFSNMRVPQPRPTVGGPNETIDALPDDANGGRFLYPNGNSEVNLFASAHRQTAANTIALNQTGTLTVCAKGGANVTLNSTVGNNGTVNIQQTERWWVSTSSQAHSDGILISQWNGSTFLAGTVNTRQVTFKMPALAPGTYFLYHGVDMLNQVTESRENDNVVREAMKIQVNNC